MKLPDNFKTSIAEVFYDKEITKYSTTTEVDDEGWVNIEDTQGSETFMGNVRFDNLAHIQQDYGIEESIDIVVSTHEDVSNGEVIMYGNVLYKIVRSIPYDSHNMLFGQKKDENQYQSS